MLWAAALLVLLSVLIFAYQAWRAGSALVDVRSQARALTSQLNSGDLRAATATADRLRHSTRRARQETGGPLWSIGAHLPWIGPNVGAVQASASVLDAISQHSLPTLLSLARDVESGPLRPRHGRIDLEAVKRLTPTVHSAARAVDGPAQKMEDIEPDRLIYPLNGLVDELRIRVTEARTAIDATADAFDVLPTMMGADGPRTYLLLVQNNAEIRSTGGMPGSWSVLHARNGKLTMGQQGDASVFATGQPVPLTSAERGLFGSKFGIDPRDITADPDFPRVAQMAARLAAAHGVHTDGVFAVDPVALAQVLQGTGPVRLHSGTVLNSGNAVPVLLSGVYRNIDDPVAQNDFYASAARKTFDALVAGKGNQVRAIRGLVLAAGQHRVLAWSDLPGVSTVIGRNKLSGAIPTDTDGTPQVGLYLNDSVAGKMEYYLRHSATATATSCTRQGVQTLKFSAAFRSTAPPAVTTYPIWVAGTGQFAPRGDISMSVLIYGPWHGSISSLRIDGKSIAVSANRHAGRQVAVLPVQLRPGQAMNVTGTMLSGPDQTGEVSLTSTPGMELTNNPVSFASACG